jgi:hypothetical protein
MLIQYWHYITIKLTDIIAIGIMIAINIMILTDIIAIKIY